MTYDVIDTPYSEIGGLLVKKGTINYCRIEKKRSYERQK